MDLENRIRKGMLVTLSVTLHVLLLLFFERVNSSFLPESNDLSKQDVRINLLPNEADATPPSEATKSLETVQSASKRPEKADYLGLSDHSTDRQTRLNPDRSLANDRSAAKLGRQQEEAKPSPQAKTDKSVSDRGVYSQLLPDTNPLSQVQARGAERITDSAIDISNAIDINTQNYRYMGFFIGFRKSLEMVWIYPMEAQERGISGDVKVAFVIERSGRISKTQLLKSSGFKILDNAVLEALRMTTHPLPQNHPEDTLVVTGNFTYSLGRY